MAHSTAAKIKVKRRKTPNSSKTREVEVEAEVEEAQAEAEAEETVTLTSRRNPLFSLLLKSLKERPPAYHLSPAKTQTTPSSSIRHRSSRMSLSARHKKFKAQITMQTTGRITFLVRSARIRRCRFRCRRRTPL